MKKRILALTLAATMVLGMSVSAMAADTNSTKKEHNVTGDEHGTSNGAVVGPEGDFEYETDSNSFKGSTQFYINVDKDSTNGKIEIEEPEVIRSSDGNICHYELTWKVEKSSNISATVPLYVCMYGYGGDGKVVTPANYGIKNESTYSYSKTLQSIVPCYKVTVIEKDKDYDFEVTDLQKSGQYGYYKENDNDDVTIVKLSDCVIHADSEKIEDSCDIYYFKGSEVQEAEGRNVGDAYDDDEEVDSEPLTINIPTIKAEAQTWQIVSGANVTSLEAGQIFMKINDLDLSKSAGNELDIRALDWKVEGKSSLNLPISAQIAGGSVNEEGCVPVVKVTYTIAPDYSGE